MIDELPERDLLQSIDPAPRTISDADRIHNLLTVLSRVDQPTRVRAPRRAWIRIALPIALVAAAAAVALPALDLSSLFSPPGGTTGQPTAILVGTTTPQGVRILANATVGTSQFLLGQRGAEVRIGASFDGSNPDDNWMSLGPPVVLAANAVVVSDRGSFPDTDTGAVTTVSGQVGEDVSAMEISTETGDTVPASIGGGYYTAAWAGSDLDDPEMQIAGFVLHLADGTTKTVTLADATQD